MSRIIQSSRKSERIRVKLAEILLHEMDDPQLRFVSISQILVDKNTYSARVYFSAPTSDSKTLTKKLNAVAPFLRKRLGQCMHTRNLPQLQFFYDIGFDQAEKIDKIFQSLS